MTCLSGNLKSGPGAAAGREGDQIVLLQETLLDATEAAQVFVTPLAPASGGVAILVRQGLPAVHARAAASN